MEDSDFEPYVKPGYVLYRNALMTFSDSFTDIRKKFLE